MTAPDIPMTETARLAALYDYDILDTPAEPQFDDLTRLAALIADVPIALISLVDAKRQWFKSRVGLDVSEISREISFCGHAIHGREVFEVTNALEDERFRDNQLVSGPLQFRFYAGTPLETPKGHRIGTLCVMDRSPRKLTLEQRDALPRLGRQVVTQLELRRANRALLEQARRTQHEIEVRQSAEVELRALNENLEGLVAKRTDELHQRVRDFRSTFDLAAMGIVHFIPEGRFSRVNPRMCEISGYTKDELEGMRFVELAHPEDRAAILEGVEHLLRGESPGITVERRLIHKNGMPVWILLKGSAVRDDDGSILYLIGMIEDISERKRTEATLHEQQEFLRLMTENLAEGVVACDANGRLNFFNKTARAWHGVDLLALPPEEWARHYDLYESDGVTPLATARIPLLRAFSGDKVRGAEMSIVAKGQPTLFVVASGAALHDSHGTRLGAVIVMHDITRSKRAEDQLRQLNEQLEARVAERTADLAVERDRLSLALASSELSMWETNLLTGQVILDQRWAKLIGKEPATDAAISTVRELLDLVPPDDRKRVLTIANGATTGSSAEYQVEHQVRTARGEFRWIQSRGKVVARDEHGRALRMIGTYLDITEQKQVAAVLFAAKNAAEGASKAKSSFLAAMSHEIRTPMNGVIGMLDVLKQTSLAPSQIEMVELVHESASSLLSVISGILDFSKIEAGAMEIEHAPTSVAGVVEKVCSLMDQLAQKNGVDLTLFTDPAIPAQVMGDALRLRQVLVNLVNNAIKFSVGEGRRGRVSIRALLAEDGLERVTVELQVSDNGIGIDEETVKRLFTPFRQADLSTTRRFGGTGLGLVISRDLVKLMGGELTVQSALNEGTTVTVRLAFPLCAEQAGSDDAATRVAGLFCIAVGSSEGLADDLAAYLMHGGATVVRAVDIATAKEQARAFPPGQSVWVIDAGHESPPVDALRAAASARPVLEVGLVLIGRGLRRRPRVAASGLIVTDGNGLTRRTLLDAVCIAAGRMQEDKEQPGFVEVTTSLDPPSRESERQKGRLILVAEDNEINQKVIRRQLALLGYAMDVVADGRAALERWRSGDYALLLTDLHMPQMDGYALTAAIRAGEKGGARYPIIAVTANALKSEARRCVAAGMDACLSKPVKLDELSAELEKWLPRAAELAPDPARSLLPQTAASVAVDETVLKKLLGDDPEVMRDFLQDFRASADKIAAELRAACEAGDAKSAGAAAHKLKSSARWVGALALGEHCAAIEQAGNSGKVEALGTLLSSFEAELAEVRRYLDSR